MMPVLIDPNIITKMQLLELYLICNLVFMFDWYHGVVMIANLAPNRLPKIFFFDDLLEHVGLLDM